MSDTPRTDAMLFTLMSGSHVSPHVKGECVSASFARKLERENAALREDRERLEEVVASFYIEVAPLVPRYPVELWENIERGRCRGTWAEDGSPYYFTVPHQLVPAFFALQRLAGLCEEKHALREFRAAIDAARAEGGQP